MLSIKKIICNLITFSVLYITPISTYAATDTTDESLINEKIASVGFGKLFVSDPKKDITTLFKKLDTYTQKKDIKKIKSLYSEDFVNNDGFDYETYFKSLKSGFESYENRIVTTTIKSISVNDDYAVVYVCENGEAETLKETSGIEGKGIVLASIPDVSFNVSASPFSQT